MFDFNRQVVVWKNVSCLVENSCELSCKKAVIHICVHPGLEQACFESAASAAAIDEALHDVADFGNVVMGWHK
ncbi:UNVERIFIED_CONTAM: hypothetical protein IGO34_35065, partial [Salmonella enterica subsp. enterica serovar Weltevreden]